MKKIIILLFAALFALSTYAQTEKEIQLHEVTVVASRTINNVEGYTTNLRGSDITKGKPTVDVLAMLPNISRENGNFKINGLAVSEIYVDGIKLADLSELDNIPGEMINKVQIKYLAGSDQNAALSGGTIWITLRRPDEGGYYGSLHTNAKWYRASGFGNEGVGGMINYRRKNLSVYDNLYLGGYKHKDHSEQQLTGSDLHTFLTETTRLKGVNFRNRLSITQQFYSGAQLGGSYLIATSNPRISSLTYGENSSNSLNKDNNTIMQEGTVKLTLPLNQKGASMELTADYFNRNSDEHSSFFQEKEQIGGVTDKNNLNLWKFKADILYPQSESLAWRFGASAQLISSAYTPSDVMESDRFLSSSIPTNTVGFTPLLYLTAQGTVWKLRYSAGINGQLNRISYEDRHANIKNHHTQWSINPTLQVMMPFGAQMNHAFMLNYKRTLNDIPYSAISSVVTWDDPYNYNVGNPDLKAQSADMVMLAVSLFRNKLNLTAIYGHSHNQIYWQTFQDNNNPELFYSKPVNISGQGIWGIGAEWMETPVAWWRFKLSGRVEITPENTTLAGIHYNKTRFKEYIDFNNTFTFPNGWGGTLRANVEPTFRTLDRTYHAVYQVSGRVYKSLLNDNLQLALTFDALGNRRKLDRMAADNMVSYKYTSPVQSVGLSLIWNFSGGKKVHVNVVEGIQDYHETKDNR